MGRIRYGLWWLDQVTAGVRARSGSVAASAAAAGRELRWATVLSARVAAARIDAARPEPWDDGKLLAFVAVVAACALAVALVLGLGIARWAMTAAGSLPFAAAGAVAVGLVLLVLTYLVFASRRSGH
ncbi:hypothetical protein BJF83_09915 [Nocardiopsis sp. CNR-923]|uniref:hypothetical protein n=1 Tax=Nocardiopsis sp. CNR-923 TaxID=1904965 RepID=UPI0009672D24|nr:hypothetical protein [Nocardiopsis sp. CNR-923]OLT29984.1 hypothetical protein BJF83_09915 [Nocardiopsis sp. CNR-923]